MLERILLSRVFQSWTYQRLTASTLSRISIAVARSNRSRSYLMKKPGAIEPRRGREGLEAERRSGLHAALGWGDGYGIHDRHVREDRGQEYADSRQPKSGSNLRPRLPARLRIEYRRRKSGLGTG